jgi:hypothetical protein
MYFLMVTMGGTAFADAPVFQLPAANIEAERTAVTAFLADLAKNSAPLSSGAPNAVIISCREAGTHRDMPLGPNAFRVNATLDAMTVLGMIAAQSIGASSQSDFASQLARAAAECSASPETSIRTQGEYLDKESAAVAMGDPGTAAECVQGLQNVPRMDVADGTVSSADRTYASNLRSQDQKAAEQALATFGAAALEVLGAWLGSESGSDSDSGSDSSSGTMALLRAVLQAASQNKNGSAGGAGIFSGAAQSALGGAQSSSGKPKGIKSGGGDGGQNPGGNLAPALAAPSGGSNAPVGAGSGSVSGGILPGGN